MVTPEPSSLLTAFLRVVVILIQRFISLRPRRLCGEDPILEDYKERREMRCPATTIDAQVVKRNSLYSSTSRNTTQRG
jgi:hypothetical protein